MKFQHTSYFCSDLVAITSTGEISIDCQLEIEVDKNGAPLAIVIPDLNSLRQLHQEINLKLSELDNKVVDSGKQMN
jgi:hypothetical protein